MFFKKKVVNQATFLNPDNCYRGFPFYSWNDNLVIKELERQIAIFKQMGFGGFYIHPRNGLKTKYLSEEYNECVKASVFKGKEIGLLPCLYDEDKWPSGYGGGFVTKNKKYGQRYLHFTRKKLSCLARYEDGRLVKGRKLLGIYYVLLVAGKIYKYSNSYFLGSIKFYAYLELSATSDKFNNETYVDVFNKEAIDTFAQITYGNYEKILIDEFGKSIKTMFTDEPQMKKMEIKRAKTLFLEGVIPWSDNFEQLYQEKYAESILEHLPEIFFESISGYQKTRLQYHLFTTALFVKTYTENLGKKCQEIGLSLTGHMDNEPSLKSQCCDIGEAMAHYPYFAIPGIDLLSGRHEYTAAKQVSSIVNQYGKAAFLCECYGVSKWSSDFVKFKEEGDWLACLGVNIRVPHLSSYSLKGEGKRDYPPSISYQAPWYQEYKLIEDYFARINLCLSNCERIVDIGIIHPIESYFLTYDKKLDAKFLKLAEIMLYNHLDYDYISESLWAKKALEGKYDYKVILLPCLKTIRKTTIAFLKQFMENGGEVITLDDLPQYIDGKKELVNLEGVKKINFDEREIVRTLKKYRQIELSCANKDCKGYLISYNKEEDWRWLFICKTNAQYSYPKGSRLTHETTIVKEDIAIRIKGKWYGEKYDCLTGNINNCFLEHKDGYTIINNTFYNNDSLLLRLVNNGEIGVKEEVKDVIKDEVKIADDVAYELKEENCLLLDIGKVYHNGKYSQAKTMIQLTDYYRKALGLKEYQYCLPGWLASGQKRVYEAKLKYCFESTIDIKAYFVCEYDEFELGVNKEKIELNDEGFYIDKAFRKYPLLIKKGRNIIELKIPFGLNDCFENCYIVGAFAVKLCGKEQKIVPLKKKMGYKDICKYGLPFYSGKLVYQTAFTTKKEKCEICIPYYNSALLKVYVDGSSQIIAFAPYKVNFNCGKGEHKLVIECFTSRENSLGANHIRKGKKASDSPRAFFMKNILLVKKGYGLVKNGLLSKPIIKEYD